jgi:hypothetical protein
MRHQKRQLSGYRAKDDAHSTVERLNVVISFEWLSANRSLHVLQCGFFRCTTFPDCPAAFSGLVSHAIHRIISSRVLNKLASF